MTQTKIAMNTKLPDVIANALITLYLLHLLLKNVQPQHTKKRRETAKEELIEKLAEYDISLSDLEEATQYFLDQLEISQSNIDTAKASTKK